MKEQSVIGVCSTIELVDAQPTVENEPSPIKQTKWKSFAVFFWATGLAGPFDVLPLFEADALLEAMRLFVIANQGLMGCQDWSRVR